MDTPTVDLPIEGTDAMRAFVFRPEGEIKGGLIILQEAFGVNAHIRDVAERFSREGYLCIAPELFHRTAPGFESGYDNLGADAPNWAHVDALTDEGLIADITAAHAWLIGQGIEDKNIGAIGYCMGGRAAYLANASLPLGAAVSYYGGGIVKLLSLAEMQHAPLLMFWGGKDSHIPVKDRNAITEALTSAEKPFTNVEFSYAGHGFFCDARASYSAQAAKEAWALTLMFLSNTISK